MIPLFAGDVFLPHSLEFLQKHFHETSTLQLLLMDRPATQGPSLSGSLAADGRIPVFRRSAIERAIYNGCRVDGLAMEELPFKLVYKANDSNKLVVGSVDKLVDGFVDKPLEASPRNVASTELPGSQQSKHKSPKLSVIVPYYNSHQFFPEALASLEAQSFHDFEVLIVDDGSEPSSMERIHPLISKSTRNIRIFRQSNHGLSYSRNMGVLQSRGELFVFFDPDDVIDPLCLEKLVWKLDQRPDLDFCFPGTVHFGEYQFTNMQPFDPERFLKERYGI